MLARYSQGAKRFCLMRPSIYPVGLLSLIVLALLLLPSGAQAATPPEWAYVVDGQVEHGSRRGISVETIEPGHYVVTFPRDITVLGVTATVNNSQGDITAVPGTNSGLGANQVMVLTPDPTGPGFAARDFTVVVYRLLESAISAPKREARPGIPSFCALESLQ
jgi:hypothetical protein